MEGVDFTVDYSRQLGFGLMGEDSRLSFNFLGTYTIKNDFTPLVELPDDVTECAGLYGATCGNPTPEWKWTSRLSWLDGPLTTSIRWRHVGAVEADGNYFVQELDSYNLFDLTLGFNVTDNFSMNVGVNNIFDKQPLILGAGAEQSNTFPSTYDVLGRDFFVSAQLRF